IAPAGPTCRLRSDRGSPRCETVFSPAHTGRSRSSGGDSARPPSDRRRRAARTERVGCRAPQESQPPRKAWPRRPQSGRQAMNKVEPRGSLREREPRSMPVVVAGGQAEWPVLATFDEGQDISNRRIFIRQRLHGGESLREDASPMKQLLIEGAYGH